MVRLLCILLLILGTIAVVYATWSLHRISDGVLVHDRNWPRGYPYPDALLLSLNDWFDARYPARPGMFKLHGEIRRVRLTLHALLSLSTLAALAGGLPLAWPWLQRRRRTRGFEIM